VAKLPEALTSIATWHTCEIDNRVKPLPALLNIFGSGSYHVERFISAEFESLLKRLLSEERFDVIIFESLFMMPYFDVVRNNSKALLVLRQYNVEHRIWQTLAAGSRNPVKKWYFGLLARRLKNYEQQQLSKPDALTTITQHDLDMLRQIGGSKPMASFPLGIELSQMQTHHAATEIPSVFHIGSMEWMPNQEAMQWFIGTVWPAVTAKHPQLRCYIAGRNMPASFKQLETNRLRIVGEVEDAAQFMQEKQIMAVPLFSGSGIRVKILEAMAMGKAIVTTTLGAQGIECEHGTHLMIADNSQDFIKCIDLLVTNPQLASELGRNARELIIRKYDNTKVIAGMLSFYQTHLTEST
jgi:glycosyltransferase involved in cell wall biosynthesis